LSLKDVKKNALETMARTYRKDWNKITFADYGVDGDEEWPPSNWKDGY